MTDVRCSDDVVGNTYVHTMLCTRQTSSYSQSQYLVYSPGGNIAKTHSEIIDSKVSSKN